MLYFNDIYDCYYDQVFNIMVIEDGGFVVVWQGDYYDYSGMMQIGYDFDIWVQCFDVDGV